MALEQQASEMSQVRIPAELNASLNRFFSDLKLRILDRAVRRASLRTGIDGAPVLQTDDILVIAQIALTDAVSELDQVFTRRESSHVRRAS
ncbi:MAG: hypothetical protein NTY19_02895 [Planctomycetota bacterium]|nr:hypothetical protein [Planctomycetota bacterium]